MKARITQQRLVNRAELLYAQLSVGDAPLALPLACPRLTD